MRTQEEKNHQHERREEMIMEPPRIAVGYMRIRLIIARTRKGEKKQEGDQGGE